MKYYNQIGVFVILSLLGIGILGGTAHAGDVKNQSSAVSEAYAPPICPHANEWTDDVNKWAHGAPWIKVLYAGNIPKAKNVGARVFYRPWDQKSGPDGDPKVGGKRMGEEVLKNLNKIPKNQWPDAISFQNEFNNVSQETAQAFMDYYDTLKAGGYAGLVVFGSYGPGGPTDIKEWERPYIKAACMKADAIETHEYWDQSIKFYEYWLAHRHANSISKYPWLKDKPWFIGEFGSDRTSQVEDKQQRSGWQDRGKLSADDYIKQIEIYRHGDPANSIVSCTENVMAVFLYQQGSPGWKNYEVLGTKVADYMQSTWKPTVGYITGIVKDCKSNLVEGAKVKLIPSGKEITTDAKGVFWFFALKPGDYTITASWESRDFSSFKTAVKAGDIKTVHL